VSRQLRQSTEPYAVYWTRQEQQRAFEAMLGERLAKLQRAIRRAERERDELRREVEELRRELHTGGTPLHSMTDLSE
jgi:predicted RNase H-like nuclease (RuvC/YqgF family)